MSLERGNILIMKHIIIALIVLLLSSETALAGKLMTFKEVEECVELDHKIFAAREELEAQSGILEGMQKELISLEDMTKALKASADKKRSAGDTGAYNTLVEEYNKAANEHGEKYRAYNELTSKHKTMSEALSALEDQFIPGCAKRKFYKRDLKKACRESPHPDTPFCTSNIK